MGARLRALLEPEEERTLYELRTATTVPQRVKDRAQVLRLSSHGWYVEDIAIHVHWSQQTVRKIISRWHQKGLGGLWDAPHPGGKRRWQEEDILFVEKTLREDPRTYNSKQLCEKLAKARQVNLSPDRLRRILKKKGVGWKRTRQSHKGKQDPQKRAQKQAELEMLQWAAAAGEIDLLYLDESGFSQWSPVSYSYYFRGEQKRLEQTRRRGRRVSILGIWQPGVRFDYGLAIGGISAHSYIRMMDAQAALAVSLV